MGHLTLISEDIIGALAHYPPDLRASILSLAPQPEWDEYVNGRYMETKRRDTSLLGGGKPVVAPGVLARGGAGRWKVDEEDTPGTASLSHPENGNSSANGVKGEFRRASSVRPERRSTADFGPARMDDGDDEESAAPQVGKVPVILRVLILCLVVCPISGARDAFFRTVFDLSVFGCIRR